MVTVTIKQFTNYWSMCVFILPSGLMIGFLAVKVENSRNLRNSPHSGDPAEDTAAWGVTSRLRAPGSGTGNST